MKKRPRALTFWTAGIPKASSTARFTFPTPTRKTSSAPVDWACPPEATSSSTACPTAKGFFGAAHLQTDWTAGCIAVTNEKIDEIWDLVQDGTPIVIHP